MSDSKELQVKDKQEVASAAEQTRPGVVFTPDVVGRMESLRNKVLAEVADDPIARQRFLYWTWTFDAFLDEAKAIHRKKTP